MNITRKINWLSSLDPNNFYVLDDLQIRMNLFYSSNSNYYESISFTESIWNEKDALIQNDIISECLNKKSILEVGCGRANILNNSKINKNIYTGIDFSADLISKNKIAYPNSKFKVITNPKVFPVESESYDLVFSHYVIEHTVYPNLFLDECKRVLKKDGILIIVAPNFLGRKGISSQKVGFSQGTGRDKFKAGKIIDMFITGFDNKIRVPLYTYFYRYKSNYKPLFLININPTCFIYKFGPDVDAVYLTYEKEIITYLNNSFNWIIFDRNFKDYLSRNNSIYIKGSKHS